MRNLLTILFLFLVTVGQCQTQAVLLETAYNKKSTEILNQFFQNWNQEIQSITEIELSKLNDTIRQAYNVFTGFYKPQNIDSLGGSEWGKDIYKNVDFLIVQNSIKIYFTDKVYYTEEEIDKYVVDFFSTRFLDDPSREKTLKRTNGKLQYWVLERYGPTNYDFNGKQDTLRDSIINFRPPINCNEKLPLYLTSKYDTLLNSFLGDKHIPLGVGGIGNPARSTGQSEERKKFLENYIKIWYGHWGGYWQLNSYPEAYSITFDKEMKYARVDFSMVYEGGEAILKNDNGTWVLLSAKRTWIE